MGKRAQKRAAAEEARRLAVRASIEEQFRTQLPEESKPKVIGRAYFQTKRAKEQFLRAHERTRNRVEVK